MPRYKQLEDGIFAKKQKSPFNSEFSIGSQVKPLRRQLVDHLADLLDPPSPTAAHTVEQIPQWESPPPIVEWAEANFIDPVTNRLIKLEEIQLRLLPTIMGMIWEKKVVTVVYSTIKKSGKTTTAGLVGSYWGQHVESPNEIITIANDLEQSQGRIYAAMVPTLKHLGWNVPEQKPMMTNYSTGSVIKAIGTSYEGEAGGNPGLTAWSELWAFRSERRKRLWEEMTPVPTRRYSIRWVETYAGFKNESEILWNLYTQAFKDGDENKPLGEKIPGLEDLPCWHIPSSKTFVYWDHEPRMSWQTPEYYEQQRAELRPNAFRRLHHNEWVSSVEVFIEPQQWDNLDYVESLNEDGDTRQLILAADGSVNHDCTTLVASTWNGVNSAPDIIRTWVWRPDEDTKIIDLTATLKDKLEFVLDNFDVIAIFYDPFQLHSTMTDLKKKYDEHDVRKLFVSFTQGNQRVRADQAFYDWIISRKLRHNKDPILREHVLNAVADTSVSGFRLAKEKTTAKIDAAVAASMAGYGASIRFRPPKKFLKV